MFRRTLSKEVRENLSPIREDGKYKQETLNKIFFALTGSKNPKSKKVFLYSNENPLIFHKEFDTYTAAAKYLNCHSSNIGRNINTNKLYKK